MQEGLEDRLRIQADAAAQKEAELRCQVSEALRYCDFYYFILRAVCWYIHGSSILQVYVSCIAMLCCSHVHQNASYDQVLR